MALQDKFIVWLMPEQCQQLEHVVSTGSHPAATVTHDSILLKADTAGPDRWPDVHITDALDYGTATVARVRKQLIQGRLESRYPAVGLRGGSTASSMGPLRRDW